jgi:hypothetical protein
VLNQNSGRCFQKEKYVNTTYSSNRKQTWVNSRSSKMGCFKHLPILHALASYICNEFDQPAPHPKYKREENPLHHRSSPSSLYNYSPYIMSFELYMCSIYIYIYIYNLNNNNLVILRSTVTVKCC